jgi:acetoin utilization protein AcuB
LKAGKNFRRFLESWRYDLHFVHDVTCELLLALTALDLKGGSPMKVSQLMTRSLITVSPDDSVEGAVRLLRQRGVRHLLVLKKGRLVGIVSDRDIKRALDPERAGRKKLMNLGGLFFLLEPILIREIMTRNVVTIGPELSIQEAASIMVTERFGALPVVKNDEPVGIVTETDLLRYFAKSEAVRDGRQSERTKRRPRERVKHPPRTGLEASGS